MDIGGDLAILLPSWSPLEIAALYQTNGGSSEVAYEAACQLSDDPTDPDKGVSSSLRAAIVEAFQRENIEGSVTPKTECNSKKRKFRIFDRLKEDVNA